MKRLLIFAITATVISLLSVGIGQAVQNNTQSIRDEAYKDPDMTYDIRLPKHYYSDGKKIELGIDKNKGKYVSIKFNDAVTKDKKGNILDESKSLKNSSEQYKPTNLTTDLIEIEEGVSSDAVISSLQKLEMTPDVEYAYPTLTTKEGQEVTLTDTFLVKFKESVNDEQAAAINEAFGAEIIEKNQTLGDYKLRVINTKKTNALELANKYYESGLVAYAHPDFITFIQPSSVPTDTLYFAQWSLNNNGDYAGTGSPADVDIDAPEAWDISTGSSAATIAIVDNGVDMNHEDLSGKLVTGYDAVDGDNNPQPISWDYHGTACAGIAAAATNNGLGMAGVAWNSPIMPIRIAYDNNNDPLDGWISSVSWQSNGIMWAANHGARVISNSWGYTGQQAPIDQLNNAINSAKSQGAVILFSTGNNNGSVSYPANLSSVIGVGASNICDQRKTPTYDSCNLWEDLWGSNFGSQLDVVAPGVRILATDNMGSAGKNVGNYNSFFNGTSSSTPIVAGIASLIIAQDPSLSPDEVQYIIQANAEDKGPSGFDVEYGFGRVNAFYALKDDINYLMPYYDQVSAGMRNWVLVANPNTNTTNVNTSISIGDGMSGLRNVYSIPSGKNVTPTYPGVKEGPVRVGSSDGTTKALFSVRSLYNDNFNETMSVPESELESDYYFSWYDSKVMNPGPSMNTYIMVANRGTIATNVQVYIGGVLKGTYPLGVNKDIYYHYPNTIGGPVRVVSTNGQKLLVSERTTYNNGFSEIMGTPASKLSNEYFFTWYDRLSTGLNTWILISNQGTGTAHTEVYIENMNTPAYTYDIPQGGIVTPLYHGVMGGPVKVKCTTGQKLIVSERTTYQNRFEELPGTPNAGLSSDAWFTWYDYQTAGLRSWIMLANFDSTQATTADIYIGGIKRNSTPITVNPGTVTAKTYGGVMDGPVEVRILSGPQLLVSQRVIYLNSFNELVGANF